MLNQKLQDFANKKSLTNTQIVEDLEVSKSVVSSYLNGSVKASKPFLKKFANFYKVDINELIDNEKMMPELVAKDSGVPYYDVDFIGGFDVVDSDNTANPTFYINFAPFNDADYWVNVTGKSMSPFISHGDLIAIKRLHNWREFMLFGEIYAIVTDDFRTIKIVTKGSQEGYLKLIPYSDDPVFVEQEIPIHLIKQVFAVKGSIKKFF